MARDEKQLSPKKPAQEPSTAASRKRTTKVRRIKKISRSGDDGRIALNHNESI